MAIEFLYSKKYSENGAVVRTPEDTDYFLLSRVVLPNPPYLLGFRTYNATLNQLKNYTVNEIVTNISDFNVDGNGLLGDGSPANPLAINDTYLNNLYYKNKHWPMTQVGDPSDFTLPLSGSYLSVSYPYTADAYPPTAILEGNGDFRLLRHVTNGEEFRVTYATWKNYANTPIDNLQISDVVYHPPGLAPNEYIHNVHPASDTAMVAEIFNENGYVEHCFIKLNDTAIADYHEYIRLGSQICDVLLAGYELTAADQIRVLRASTIMAAIVKGKNYVAAIMPVKAGFNQVQFSFAEVSEEGLVTRINNWTTTNTEGQVVSDPTYAVVFRKVETHDQNDKDAVYYLSDPDMYCSSTTTAIGTSPFNRASWSSTGDNQMIVVSQHYCQVNTLTTYGAAHAIFFYVVNFDTRTMSRVPTRMFERPTFGVNPNGSISYPSIWLPDRGHYYALGRYLQILPNGDRIYYSVASSSQDVIHATKVYRNQGPVNGLAAAPDENFGNSTPLKQLNPIPPTAVYSGRQATIVFDNMVQMDSVFNQAYDTNGNYAKLIGSDTAKSYELLNQNSFLPKVTYQGYALNNDRGEITNGLKLNINSFLKNGVGYYHNAMFYAYRNEVDTFSAKIDSNLNGIGYYNCNPSVYTTMENFLSAQPPLPGYTTLEDSDWLLVPPYPGIGFDYAMYKFMISWKIVDNTVPLGYRWSGIHVLIGLAPATYTRDSLGNYTLQSIDLSNISLDWQLSTGTYFMTRNISRYYGASAWDIGATEFVGIIRGGPPGVRSHFGSNHDGWRLSSFKCALDGSGNTVYPNKPSPYDQPVVHPLHGLGIVTSNAGLGTFYTFIPVNKESMTIINDVTTYRILGTARPAAGFNYTITVPIEVNVDGKSFTIPVQTVDLTTISSSYQNTVFYCYVRIFNGVATWVTTKSKLEEHMYCIYAGKITTTATEIETIDCRPITRWEIGRVSPYPIGSAMAASTGTAGTDNTVVWTDAVPLDISGSEYLWDSDDIVDEDPMPKQDVVINVNSTFGGTSSQTDGYYVKRGLMVTNYIRSIGLDVDEVASITITVANGVALVGGLFDGCNYGIDFGDELIGIPKQLIVNGAIFGAGGSRYTRLDGYDAVRGVTADTVPLQLSLNSTGWICGGGGSGEGRVSQNYSYAGGGAPYGRGYGGGGDATLLQGGPQNDAIGNDGGDVGRAGDGETAGQPGDPLNVAWIQWDNNAGRLGPI